MRDMKGTAGDIPKEAPADARRDHPSRTHYESALIIAGIALLIGGAL